MTMAIAIGLSALNALTLSPALCAVLLKPHKQEGSEDIPPLKERMKTAYKTAHTTMINRYTELSERCCIRESHSHSHLLPYWV